MEYEILNNDDELTHWGTKGMKWGIRRYQNKDGSLTPAGKKRYDREMERIKAETKRLKNQQRTATKLKKLEDAKKNLNDLKKGTSDKPVKKDDPNEDIEAKKDRILKSRSAKALYDNANLFTTAELTAAKTRLELEANIKKLDPPVIEKGKAFADKFIENADTITKTVDSGSKAYNSFAKVYNSLYGNKHGVTLPLISDKVGSKLEKFKEETEWIKAKNERKSAEETRDGTPKSELEKLKEKTALLAAQNKQREAERTSRAHDEADRREAETRRKEREEAAEAERKKQEEAAAAERKKQEEATRKAEMDKYEEERRKYEEPQKSGKSTFTDSEYHNAGGERVDTTPNKSRALVPYNNSDSDSRKTTSEKATESGKTYVNSNNTTAPSTNVVSRIGTMTSSGKYTNSQIAERLGISTSTVSRYSNGRKLVESNAEKLMTYDEDGNFVGYWSERMTADGFI